MEIYFLFILVAEEEVVANANLDILYQKSWQNVNSLYIFV